ncbi:MAG: hypothetical protein ACFFD6_06320 [Candidatus Thorarchaeota archaeon]
MKDTSNRSKFLRAIKKVLSDVHALLQDTMDTLDEIGTASVGTGMTPLMGGYAMKDPKDEFRTALAQLDAAEKSLEPLSKRFRDGRVNESHFTNPEALTLLKDIVEFDYGLLKEILAEQRGRESVWYRLRELSQKTEDAFAMVAEK